MIPVPFYEVWNLNLTPGTTTFTILNFISRMNVLNGLLSSDFKLVKDAFTHLILPALALGTIPMALIARMSRSAMLEVLGQDYIRTAHAKGLSQGTVLYKHALRNALIPVITVITLSLPFLFSGAIATETVFGYPGMGQLFITSIFVLDIPLVMAFLLIITTLIVLSNILADVLYAVADPRIHYS